ncbi:MAG TPA: helix-turn-helix domain-containing protein [Micromonosporaceae bacterium]|nr:helix-turn-helix domain-containing protein [Micromonosporaceae bacterium]
MGDPIELAVTRAIKAMQENLGEPLTVDDLARAAMFSKFHFTRIFQRATGVSPGRFLSALRLQRAKHLLTSTSLTVADISICVGYHSVGTFSSRFSRSVGMSPTTYRRMAGFAPHISTDPCIWRGQASSSRVSGWIRFAHGAQPGMIFVGLFPERIPQGRPVRCAVLPQASHFSFKDVPVGMWYLLAQSVTCDPQAPLGEPDSAAQTVSVASRGLLVVHRDSAISADLVLEPVRVLDPPVLLALLDVRKLALSGADQAEPAGPSSVATAVPPAAALVGPGAAKRSYARTRPAPLRANAA